MFKLADTYQFWYPVKVKTPHPEKAGEFEEQTFDALFEPMPLDEAREFDKKMAALPPIERTNREHDLIRESLKDWKGVVDGNGKHVGFSAEALEKMLQFSWARTGLYRAYWAALNGEAAAGN